MSRNSLLEASEIWSLSDSNWTRTHSHLVHKRTLNHLAKLAKWLTSRFTLKRVRYMTRTHSQMHRTDKYSQHSSILWPVWLNGWVFLYQLSVVGSSPVAVTYLLCICIVNALPLEFWICIFLKFVSRLFALSLIHIDIIHEDTPEK